MNVQREISEDQFYININKQCRHSCMKRGGNPPQTEDTCCILMDLQSVLTL